MSSRTPISPPGPPRSPFPIILAVLALAAFCILAALWRQAPRLPPPGSAPTTRAVVPPSPPAQPLPEDSVVLGPEVRALPGVNPTRVLRYRDPAAGAVAIAGAWDYWAQQHPMARRDGVWEFDTTSLKLPLGRYEFKFITDTRWEVGDNRVLYINPDGLVQRPPELIYAARLETPRRIDVLFKRDVPRTDAIRARLIPDVPVSQVKWRDARGAFRTVGYAVAGDIVTFYLDEKTYDLSISPQEMVTVAGSFNGWRTDGLKGVWQLHDDDDDGVWTTTVQMEELNPANHNQEPLIFKFVVNQKRWLSPPSTAPNAFSDGKGNYNLKLDPLLSSPNAVEVHTAQPLSISNHYVLVLENLGKRAAFREVTPGAALDAIQSTQKLGPQLDAASGSTTFRVFAPRASRVELHLYDGPRYQPESGPGGILDPRTVVPMNLGPDGVWTTVAKGVGAGQYFVYKVDGTTGSGEGFSPRERLADPYARAIAHGPNNAIVIDPAATNAWFTGWTDSAHRVVKASEAVIYETHVRDLTIDPSSAVPEALRGKYAGLLATRGLGTGLDHLKELGINTIELLPTAEFANGTGTYDWGYGPAFYFAPEASYAQAPLTGSQYYEFKNMVNELHRQGFSVILDVVYNHIGYPNAFYLLDRKYYFRQDQDYNLENFSGCGNDVRTEAPMMRRLIVDNVLYWMREHHVDGFRFDLAELVDMETLMAVRDAARAANPDVILISEPWSLRGDHRTKLKGKGWSAWNGNFRYAVHDFVRGRGNRDDLRALIRGSVDTWTANPLQAVNYLESHDDMAYADEITTNPGKDGRNANGQDGARNRLGATVLFTSLGIPMIAEGQEWMRSKQGFGNTFDKGDAVNALHWQDRERAVARDTMMYYRDLVRLRGSAAGASFRWDRAVPDDYIQWITPSDGRALGYIVNGRRQGAGAPFVVLLNAADGPMNVQITFPPGQWRQIGDGRRILEQGIPDARVTANPDGSRSVQVPAVTAFIFMGV